VREIPTEPWTAKELPLVIQYAPNPIDRDYALAHLVDNGLTDGGIQAILASLRKDREQYCAVRDTLKLAGLNLPELHDFWVEETKHPNIERRTCAATGLAGVSRGPADFAILKGLLADDQPYTVVAAALRGLASLDFPEVGDFALKAAKTSKNQDIRAAALDVLADAKAPGWDTAILETAAEGHTTFIRRIGVRALTKLSPDDSRLAASVRSALHAGEDQVVSAAIEVAGSKHLTAVLPDLQALKARGAHVGEADAAIQKISR
jgi:hypothetical protein